MQDPAFRRLFRHPVTIEMLVREHAPERAAKIDFSTLERNPTEQVGEALVRRYPDMIWTAKTHGETGQVVILLEFQSRPDRLMALRMAVYQLLTVQELLERTRPSVSPDRLEVLSFVIHHGKRPWGRAPSLRRLFGRWVPGDFKVVEPDWDQSTDRSTDLAAIILALERERSIDATVRMTSTLARVAERTGSAFDRFMADCVREMLISTGRITRAQLKEAETMAQVSTTLEDWGTERFRQGIHQERAAHAAMVCARAGDRFGAEAAEAISALLGDSPDLAQLLAAAGAVFSSETPDELLERVRVLSKG